MTRKSLVISSAAIALSLLVTVAALAQQHGVPHPEKVYGDGVTWPLKIRVWKYDMKQLLAPPAMSDSAKVGRVLWVQKCAYCHDGVGSPTYRTMGPWLSAEMIRNLGEANAKAFIKSGDVRMPAFKYNLSDAQIDHLIAFIKTIGPDQRPTPAQLAGKGEPGAASD